MRETVYHTDDGNTMVYISDKKGKFSSCWMTGDCTRWDLIKQMYQRDLISEDYYQEEYEKQFLESL